VLGEGQIPRVAAAHGVNQAAVLVTSAKILSIGIMSGQAIWIVERQIV
jgi:uncharacterized protein YoaH (UPF0181 family)